MFRHKARDPGDGTAESAKRPSSTAIFPSYPQDIIARSELPTPDFCAIRRAAQRRWVHGAGQQRGIPPLASAAHRPLLSSTNTLTQCSSALSKYLRHQVFLKLRIVSCTKNSLGGPFNVPPLGSPHQSLCTSIIAPALFAPVGPLFLKLPRTLSPSTTTRFAHTVRTRTRRLRCGDPNNARSFVL